jgi:hypothetical protein
MELKADNGSPLEFFDARQPYYHVMTFVCFKFARTVSPGTTAMGFMKFFNFIIGLISLALFYLFMRLVSQNPFVSLFATGFMAFCNVFWYSIKGADSNVFVFLLVVLFLLFLFKLHENIPALVFHLIVGLILGVILLFDVTALILIIPVFFFNPYGREKQMDNKLIALLVALAVLALGLYIHFWVSPLDDIGMYGNYLVESLESDFYTGKTQPVFNLSPMAALTPLMLTGAGVIGGSGAFSILLKLLAGLAIITILVIAIVKWDYVDVHEKNIINFAFTWFLPMLIFYGFWSSSLMINSILWLPPLAILVSVTIFAGKWIVVNRIALIVGAVLLGITVLGNLAFVVLPSSSLESNPELLRTEYIKDNLFEEDTLIFFETKEESEKEKFFTYYLPFEARRKSFTINWRHGYRLPVDKIAREINKVSSEGTMYLLIRNNLDGAMTPEEFEYSFSPFYLTSVSGMDGAYSLYMIN